MRTKETKNEHGNHRHRKRQEKEPRPKAEIPVVTTTSMKTKKKEVVIREPTDAWPDPDMITTSNMDKVLAKRKAYKSEVPAKKDETAEQRKTRLQKNKRARDLRVEKKADKIKAEKAAKARGKK